MNEINKNINNYIRKEIVLRLSENNDAHKWIVNQVDYYTNPEYKNNEYTTLVLKRLQELNNKVSGEAADTALRLLV